MTLLLLNIWFFSKVKFTVCQQLQIQFAFTTSAEKMKDFWKRDTEKMGKLQ